MSRSTFISAGSNTRIASAGGVLYGITASGPTAAGAIILVQDSVTGLGASPNYNSVAHTGLIAHVGPLIAGVTSVPFHGVRFENGLTVAASSNAKLTVYYGS